jgi:hypothetical protein
MASCTVRDEVRQRTIASLSSADWQGSLTVEFDDPNVHQPHQRQMALVRRILGRAAKEEEIFLLLEDDLDFNRHLCYNLAAWPPLNWFKSGDHFFASLYNPGVQFVRSFPESCYAESSAAAVLGSQALLISRATASYMVMCWGVETQPYADVKLAHLATRVCPIFYHLPSLVQHLGVQSLWGGPFHSARDFDKDWKSSG